VITVYSPEATALRLILSAAAAGNDDSLTETLREFIGQRCPGCQTGTVMLLLDLLVFALDQSGTDWQAALSDQLCEVLDSMTEVS
jgi:hypothetical protein